MLVLTRKQGERIRIGKDVTITVIRMKGKAIRLGIEAPQNLSVLRGELCDRDAVGQVDDGPVRPASTAMNPSERQEQTVASDAWPPAETQPDRPASDSGPANPTAVDSRPASRPLRSLVEQRGRAGETC